MVNKYSEKEQQEILESMKIIIDTREKKKEHITRYLDNKKIPYTVEKLDSGDYTAMIPANPELGIPRDIYMSSTLTIERKASLEELSANLTKGRAQIESEFLRARGRMIIMIEDATYDDIINHKYNTQYNPKSFLATLKAFESRYGIETTFVSKRSAGNFIYHSLYYELREQLRTGKFR